MNLQSQPSNPGENTLIHVPEHELWSKDLMLDKIKDLKNEVNIRFDRMDRVEAIVKALRKAEEEISNEAVRKNVIKKKVKIRNVDVVKENIKEGSRKRSGSSKSGGVPDTNTGKVKKKKIEVGGRVKIKTLAFGKRYAAGLPEFTYGLVRGKKGDMYDVLWDAGDSMQTHKRHLTAE